MATAIVNQATGNVLTFVRPDRPAGWQPPEGCVAIEDSKLPLGWKMETVTDPVDVRLDDVASLAKRIDAIEKRLAM